MRRQKISVRFHPHALDRLRQRLPGVKKERIRGQLRHRIPAELRKGARPNASGALKVEVEIGSGIWAVCFPSLMGGWEVMTIYREGSEDMEEKVNYGEDKDKHWEEVMELAQRYGFIVVAAGGTAILATHKNQRERFGEEEYRRIQKMNRGRQGT